MATASYKGKYKPINKDKYLGNPNRIVYRSNWERRFMVYCDRNDAILHWGSEEIAIRYRNLLLKKYQITFLISLLSPKRQRQLLKSNLKHLQLNLNLGLVRLEHILMRV